jgi:hypothetical protein
LQQTLFGTEADKLPEIKPKHIYDKKEQTKFVAGEVRTEKQIHDSKYTDEYCFDKIEKEEYLWDMRCWDVFHNREEVLVWVGERDNMMSCGHIRYCINALLDRGMDKEIIADHVLKNNKIKYKNRIVKCFRNGTNCPEYIKNKGYGSGCNCKGCE